MSHTFDPEKEPATVEIEVNPNRYVKINGKVLYVEKQTDTVILPDGKLENRTTFNQETSRMWVPPRLATRLTGSNSKEVYARIPPIAREVGRRTVEEAQGKPAVTRKPVATKTE